MKTNSQCTVSQSFTKPKMHKKPSNSLRSRSSSPRGSLCHSYTVQRTEHRWHGAEKKTMSMPCETNFSVYLTLLALVEAPRILRILGGLCRNYLKNTLKIGPIKAQHDTIFPLHSPNANRSLTLAADSVAKIRRMTPRTLDDDYNIRVDSHQQNGRALTGKFYCRMTRQMLDNGCSVHVDGRRQEGWTLTVFLFEDDPAKNWTMPTIDAYINWTLLNSNL